MKIKIIAVGKIKEKYLKDAVNEYLKRMSAYAKLEIIEVADEKEPENASQKDLEMIREKEAKRIVEKVKERDYVILLDINGKMLSSEEVAGTLGELSLSGDSSVAFIIGGSTGVADLIKNRADFAISFSKMTFPHQLMRVILLEQVYRAFKILRNEPYHK